MKRKNLLMSLTLAGALSALSGQANATAWMDFEDTSLSSVNLSNQPSVLNRVTVVCPATGFLVARSSSHVYLRNQTAQPRVMAIAQYSISRNIVRHDTLNSANVIQNLGPNTLAEIPASVQRIDACNSGETHTYYHTVLGSAGPGNIAFANRYKLVVEFFNRRI